MQRIAILLWGLLVVAIPGFCAGQAIVEPKHVYQYARQLSQTTALIADTMGVTLRQREPIDVSGVSPREVYFQAVTFYKKTGRLMYEFTRKGSTPINSTLPDAGSEDVLKVLQQAGQYLDIVTGQLQLEPVRQKVELVEGVEPKDVLAVLIDASRAVNQLLEFRFSPADSYEQITASISHASAILQTLPNVASVFDPEPYRRGVKPREVYLRLIDIHAIIGRVFDRHGLAMLTLGEGERNRTDIVPSDVYDLATLVLSQLSYLHVCLANPVPPKPSFYPGKVVPAQVFQRTSILEKQVNMLLGQSHRIVLSNRP